LPADAVSAAGAAGALDLHEELSEGYAPSTTALRCTCGSPALRLRSSHGELVELRGKSVNFCAYCARLAAIENVEMLALDALQGHAPEVWLVLTTRTATVDMSVFYAALADVKRMIRKEPLRDADGVVVREGRKIVRRWPDAEYANCLEYSTGYGTNSGGQRRPHFNVLFKGVPAGDAGDLEAVAAPVWCDHVDALPAGQRATSVYEAGGLTRYLAIHFNKEGQLPPAEFRGQRFNCSRGYFTGCTRRVARQRAKSSLAYKRALNRATDSVDVRAIAQVAELTGDTDDQRIAAELADWLARYELQIAATTEWILTDPTGNPRGQLFKPATGRIVQTETGHRYEPQPSDRKVTPAHWTQPEPTLILDANGNPLPWTVPTRRETLHELGPCSDPRAAIAAARTVADARLAQLLAADAAGRNSLADTDATGARLDGLPF